MIAGMRSYGQYCALAKALDLVGDRWTLLIVRELGLRGPSRYTDLQHGLPGIATNMLADRLREMEDAGIVRREAAPPPVATTLFQLTERGQELVPVLFALGRPPVTIELRTGDQPIVVEATGGAIRTHPGGADDPDAIVTGEPDIVIGLLKGRLDLRDAKRRGLRVDGDAKALRRLQPLG